MATVDLTAIVVSYNRPDLLARCLDSLLEQRGIAFDVVVVDNASTDAGIRGLAGHYPIVRWGFNSTNAGYGAACNQGFRFGSAPLLVTLNNDLELRPGFLQALADAATSDGRVGMSASVLLQYSDPRGVDSAGIAIDRVGISWERFAGRNVDATDLDAQSPPLLGPVGGAALYRREMIDEIGGFDESLGMYHEDLDLAWRARNAGWESALATSAQALHHHSATAGLESPLKRYLLARNKLLVIAANYPVPALYAYLPMILAYDAIAAAWYVTMAGGGASGASKVALVRGRLAALAHLPGAIARGRKVRRTQRLSPTQAFALLAPAEAPWRARSRFQH